MACAVLANEQPVGVPRSLSSVPPLGGNAEVISRPLRLDARFFKSRQQTFARLAGLKPQSLIWYNTPMKSWNEIRKADASALIESLLAKKPR